MSLFDFTGIKKAISALTTEHGRVSKELEDAQKRRLFLTNGSVQKAEYKEWMLASVDFQASEYSENLRIAIEKFRIAPDVDRPGRIIPFLGTVSGGNAFSDRVMPAPLFAIFGNEIKAAIGKMIDSWDWPDECVPLKAEREKEIAALDKKIASLQQTLTKIRKDAGDAGITIKVEDSSL